MAFDQDLVASADAVLVGVGAVSKVTRPRRCRDWVADAD